MNPPNEVKKEDWEVWGHDKTKCFDPSSGMYCSKHEEREFLGHSKDGHDTKDGFCCACEYDLIYLNSLFAADREEIRKSVEGMRSVDHANDRGDTFYSGYHDALDDVLRLISNKE